MTTKPEPLAPPRTWRDLAKVTGLCEPVVKAAIRNGDLPGDKIGKKYVIPAAAFEDYIHGRWQPVPKPRPIIRPLPNPDDFRGRRAS